MTLPRCACGRKAVTVAPGSDAIHAPGKVLVSKATPTRGWCQRCAERRGWLVREAVCAIATGSRKRGK